MRGWQKRTLAYAWLCWCLTVSLTDAACSDNICDCSWGYTISGIGGSIGACSFPGVSSLNSEKQSLTSKVSSLQGQITQLKSDIADITNQVDNFPQVVTNTLTGDVGSTLQEIKEYAASVTTFLDDSTKFGKALLNFSRNFASFVDLTSNMFPNDPSIFIQPGKLTDTTLLRIANWWFSWISDTLLSPKVGVWVENPTTDCWYENTQNGNITFGVGVTSSPEVSLTITLGGVGPLQCLLTKKFTMVNSLARTFINSTRDVPAIVAATRAISSALQGMADAIGVVAQELGAAAHAAPFCGWKAPNIHTPSVPSLSPDWLSGLSDLVNKLNAYANPGGILQLILQELSDAFCGVVKVPDRLTQFSQDFKQLLSATERDLPETIVKKLFNAFAPVYTLLTKEGTCLQKEFQAGSLSVHFTIGATFNVFPPNAIEVSAGLSCGSVECLTCISGVDSISGMMKRSSSTNQIASTLSDSGGINFPYLTECHSRLDLCPSNVGTWDSTFCTCICFNVSQIWTIQYGCFDKVAFMNGEAPAGGDPTINPYNPAYSPTADPANPENPNSEHYALKTSGARGQTPSVGIWAVLLLYVLGASSWRKLVFLSTLTILLIHVTPAASLDVCSTGTMDVCVSVPDVCTDVPYPCGLSICHKSVCTPSPKACVSKNVCDVIPEVKTFQGVLNDLYSTVSQLTDQVTSLSSQKADIVAQLTAKELSSGLSTVKDELQLLQQVAASNLEAIPQAFQATIRPLILFANLSTSMFQKSGALSELGVEVVNQVMDWWRNAVLDPYVLDNCENCWSDAVRASQVSWGVEVGTGPTLSMQMTFGGANVLQCFVKTMDRVRRKVGESVPPSLRSSEWWVTKEALEIAVKSAASSVESLQSSVVSQGLCSLKSLLNPIDVPTPASTGVSFVDQFAEATSDLARIMVGGPVGNLGKLMIDSVCSQNDSTKFAKFFDAVELFVASLQPPSPYTIVTRTLFTILDKTNTGLQSFLNMDFSDSRVAQCALLNSAPECSLIKKYSVSVLRCVQQGIASMFDITLHLDFGENWFPPSIVGAGISMGGSTMDNFKCLLGAELQHAADGDLTLKTDFVNLLDLLINDIVGLQVTDFIQVTCPTQQNCSPGTYSADFCACVCPSTHVPRADGCIECPGIVGSASCGGHGKCVLDWPTNTPKCCCQDGWSGSDCSTEA